ncbi:hypothetical protein [Chryseobacterium arthrosphaerae]|uniref:Uncharacterized protein n=1 Tax=Chryseobacterium arthrosphaerae TaxID=651561 RepID=A0A3S0N9D8_9FLAO|nr:hypothetical protein [Chryseobacterium arthrosphaerae]RTZ50290.1 hypothetical protein EJ377_10580 [Chryseobacterium arthrosphaerae]
MITLYKLTSEKELLGIGKTLFKEFISDIPLHFHTVVIPDPIPEPGMFLVKCEIQENTISNFKRVENGELMVETDRIPLFNTLINDKIKIVDYFGHTKEFEKEILEVLEKEERFFKIRLDTFLETNDHTIIPYDYLDQQIDYDNDISEQNEEDTSIQYDEKRSEINTVEEAVDFLINEELSEDTINEIRNRSLASKFDEMGGLFGLGMYLRNVFIYPNKNEKFLQHLKTYDPQYLVSRGEFGEGIIEDLLWRKLNHCLIKDESKNKIAELKKEEFKEETFWGNYIKEQLLSYNLADEVIREYLDLEDKKDSDEENFEFYYYEQKRILAGMSNDERSVYDQLSREYFTVRDLIEKLKQKS